MSNCIGCEKTEKFDLVNKKIVPPNYLLKQGLITKCKINDFLAHKLTRGKETKISL